MAAFFLYTEYCCIVSYIVDVGACKYDRKQEMSISIHSYGTTDIKTKD